MNVQEFLDAGYYKFTQKNLKIYTENFLQKRFDDLAGKKYFITVAVYDNQKYKDNLKLDDFSFEPNSQFISNGIIFDISMLPGSFISVIEIEYFFEKLWKTMDCDYYEMTNDSITNTI